MARCVASGSVCRPIAGSHLTCPFGLHNPPGSCRVVYQAHFSRLSARATRPYPPGYDFPLPFGGWRSLLGPSCARCGLGPSFRRSSGLLAWWARPQRGYHVPHQLRRGGGGCLLYCATWVPRRAVATAARFDQATEGGLVPGRFIVASAIGCDDLSLRSLDGGYLAFAHPVFPSPGSPGWFRLALGFTRLLSHATLPGRLRGSGTDLGTSRGSGDSPRTTHLERLRVARPLRFLGASIR